MYSVFQQARREEMQSRGNNFELLRLFTFSECVLTIEIFGILGESEDLTRFPISFGLLEDLYTVELQRLEH